MSVLREIIAKLVRNHRRELAARKSSLKSSLTRHQLPSSPWKLSYDYRSTRTGVYACMHACVHMGVRARLFLLPAARAGLSLITNRLSPADLAVARQCAHGTGLCVSAELPNAQGLPACHACTPGGRRRRRGRPGHRASSGATLRRCVIGPRCMVASWLHCGHVPVLLTVASLQQLPPVHDCHPQHVRLHHGDPHRKGAHASYPTLHGIPRGMAHECYYVAWVLNESYTVLRGYNAATTPRSRHAGRDAADLHAGRAHRASRHSVGHDRARRVGDAGAVLAPTRPVNGDRWATPALRAALPKVRCDYRGRLVAHFRHLHRGWAHPCHICAGTGLAPAAFAPGLGSPLPRLRRD